MTMPVFTPPPHPSNHRSTATGSRRASLLRGVWWLLLWIHLQTLPTATADCGATTTTVLPPDVQAAKEEIIALSLANVDRWGEPDVQALVEAQAVILEAWFVDHRPADEIALTQQSWFGIYYEDVSILDDVPFFNLDRRNTYQVVREGFYYNVGRLELKTLFGWFSILFTSYLKGQYELIDLADDTSCGEPKRNVISLTFRDNRLDRKWLSSDALLSTVVDNVDSGDTKTLKIPGPSGVTGMLWNRFVDDELRVSQGGNSEETSTLFVLTRQDFVS